MIVVHHLNFSRSTRVLWLLEELGLEYALVLHERLPGFRAPSSLTSVHPSGKAPVVVLDGEVVSESAVILVEIDARYGRGRFAPAIGTVARLRHDEWLHFAEGSVAMPLMTLLYGRLSGGLPPTLSSIVERDARLVLDRLETRLRDSSFLAGEEFSLADIQMDYLAELAGHMGMLAGRGALASYLSRLHLRDGYRRAIARGGPTMPVAAGVGGPG